MTENNPIADAAEREAAIDPQGSFIVQAPAGSGKTELLMQRFLALLCASGRPEEILAMTFTRKAAAQMRGRILDALRAAASDASPDRPHERKTHELAAAVLERDAALGWGLLENPARLKVQTIDSFCASVVRAAPLLSLSGGLLAVSENPRELYREAASRAIELVDDVGADGEAVRAALRHMDNSVAALNDRLIVMLEKRDQWLRHVDVALEVDEDELRSKLEGAIRRLVEARLKDVCKAFPAELDGWLLDSARFAVSNLGPQSPVQGLAGLTQLPGASSDDLSAWQGIGNFLMTDKGMLRKPLGINVKNGFPADKPEDKKAFKDLLAEFSDKEEFLRELAEVQRLPCPRYDDYEWETLRALIRLLPVAVRLLHEVFTESGEEDFQEVASAAIIALGSDGDPSDILLALDIKLRHILVDEYQDTSYIQLRLLNLLTAGWCAGDGRTLFVVGDPMQSIFLWREAQVGLFLEAKQAGLKNVRLAPLTLKTNFRSQANIVNWVNETFVNAFPGREDVFTGSVRYEPSVAYKAGVGTVLPCLRLFNGRSDIEEANEVAAILKTIDKEETAAILCRSRSHLAVIVEALKKEGLTFRARDFDPLSKRVVVQDLFALLRVLLHPYDRTAWLAALRGPWCGLTLPDMHKLCFGDKDSPVWSLINDEARLTCVSPDGRARILCTREKLAKAVELRGRMPIRRLLEGLWIDLGGPACVDDEAAMEDADAFLEVVDAVSAGGRVDPLKSIEERIESLYAGHGSADTRLELMTIHKAKGLEFDNVIIPGLGRTPRREDKKLLVWMERGGDLLLAPVERRKGGSPSPLYNYLANVEKEKRRLEAVRLFYVAATRPRTRLYLFGHIKDGKPANASLLVSCAHLLKDEETIETQLAAEGGTAVSARLKRLPVGWNAPPPLPAILTEGRTPEATELDAPEFHWAGEAIKHVGTAVHRYLCRIASEGIEKWGRERVRKEEGRLAAILRSLGLGMVEARARAPQCADIICKAINDKRGRWALSSHAEAASELSVTVVVDNAAKQMIIDRTFVDEDGLRWVIDYKASSHEGGSLDEFLKQEKERYAPQLERYAAALRALGEKREIRKGIYYPALAGWIEW